MEQCRDSLRQQLREVNSRLRDSETDERRAGLRRYRLKSIVPGRAWSGGSLPTKFVFQDLEREEYEMTIPREYPGFLEVNDDIIEECRVQAVKYAAEREQEE